MYLPHHPCGPTDERRQHPSHALAPAPAPAPARPALPCFCMACDPIPIISRPDLDSVDLAHPGHPCRAGYLSCRPLPHFFCRSHSPTTRSFARLFPSPHFHPFAPFPTPLPPPPPPNPVDAPTVERQPTTDTALLANWTRLARPLEATTTRPTALHVWRRSASFLLRAVPASSTHRPFPRTTQHPRQRPIFHGGLYAPALSPPCLPPPANQPPSPACML